MACGRDGNAAAIAAPGRARIQCSLGSSEASPWNYKGSAASGAATAGVAAPAAKAFHERVSTFAPAGLLGASVATWRWQITAGTRVWWRR